MRQKNKLPSVTGATETIRESSQHSQEFPARLMKCTHGWDDLVIPNHLKDSLRRFVFEAKERKQLWEQQNVRNLSPKVKGLMCLFTGESGTGKTMASEVLANELNLDLYRIDLSQVVSKYIGETEKNLKQLLARAESMDVLLLFDEADALFGKRTEVKDAHDRYANTDTNYLLQAIENYRGIVILASNKKENIDEAFLRRLRYVIDFPWPED